MRILVIIFLGFFGNMIAQETTAQDPNTIQNQFKKVYKQSGKYQIYRVVKTDSYRLLEKNVNDTIANLKKDIATKQAKINTQQENISSLQGNINTLQGDLATSNEKVDNISLFGIPMSKASYNVLLWSIIGGLLAALLFFIYKFNSSNSLTKEAKNSLADVELEFEQHRKKSLEKEQKLRRQLQDEINKQRGV